MSCFNVCARFRNELQLLVATVGDATRGSQRRQPRERGRRRAKRVGVHAGEERQERRPDRHEQQQHIADTRLPSGPDGGPPPVVAGRAAARRGAAVQAADRGVAAVRLGPRSRGRAFRASRVRPLGHGPVRGHSRVEETPAGRPTDEQSADRRAEGRATTAARPVGGATVAGTAGGPVPAARRRTLGGAVRLQAAAVEHQHGWRTTGPAVGRGQAAAASAVGCVREIRPAVRRARRRGGAAAWRRDRADDGVRQERDARVEIERALFDNTGRLSRRRGRLLRRRRLPRRAQIRRAGQPHCQRAAERLDVLLLVLRRIGHAFRPGNGPLTDEPHSSNDKFLSLDILCVPRGNKIFYRFPRESHNREMGFSKIDQ